MRLLKLALLIGLAGSLVSCGPTTDDSASKEKKTVEPGTKAAPETGRKGPADTPGTKPDVKPEPHVILPVKEDPGATSVGGRAINLASADSGTTVSAGVGDTVIIELKANPTTGYSWAAEPAADAAILELKSKKFLTSAQLNPEMQPLVGQGGVTTFTYRVAGAGKAAISLVYRRPWEKDVKPEKTFGVEIEATKVTSPVVTGKIVFSEAPDVEKISRIVVSIRNTALADGPAPLVGTVELTPPFKLPVTFAVPYDPAKVQPNPMFYSISVRVSTVVDGSEKLYYINDTSHHVFRDANDTKCDVAVKKLR